MRVVSRNVKGLRSPGKRIKIVRHLKKLKVALLQETHLSEDDFFYMQKLWVGKVIGLAAQGRKARVADPVP